MVSWSRCLFIMAAFSAPTLFQLTALVTWTCLSDTPTNFKNALYARFFASQEELETIGRAACCFRLTG